MIIRLTLENWKSFRESTTFNMIATRERKFGERVFKSEKYQTRILPIAVIHGFKETGKTNFVEALEFIRRMVCYGISHNELIPVERFEREEIPSSGKPSRFYLEFLINDNIYEFSFCVNRTKVLEEKLVLIGRSKERILYSRIGEKIQFYEYPKIVEEAHQECFKGTRENQLFINAVNIKGCDRIREAYSWFWDTLVLVKASSFFEYLEKDRPMPGIENKVYVIDDVGQRLHPLLIRAFLEIHLEICTTRTKKQLILTTRDVRVIHQKYLRCDEMWAMERDYDGDSNLFPLSDYKDIRYDKDIQQSYMQGRMSQLPMTSVKIFINRGGNS
jgi:AAA15 family ATPase/GTPase